MFVQRFLFFFYSSPLNTGRDIWYFTANIRINTMSRNAMITERVMSHPNSTSPQYANPPTTLAIAYISFWKMTGTLFRRTSRITPPAEPVIVPIIIATQNGCPQSRVFCSPATVNSASPSVSKKNHVLSSLFSDRANIITKT